MVTRATAEGSPRLVSRAWTAVVLVVLVLAAAMYAGLGSVSEGPTRWAAWLAALAWLLVLVAAVTAFVVPRRRRELVPGPDGTVRVESPALLAGSLVAAWFLVLVVAVLWAWVAVTDVDRIESPGFTFLVVLGAVASLPDLVRLLTGRLHRWRLVLGPEELTYEGYRTRETVPYRKLHGARVQRERPVGVLVDRKGAGPDLVIPSPAFLVPAEQLAEVVTARVARR